VNFGISKWISRNLYFYNFILYLFYTFTKLHFNKIEKKIYFFFFIYNYQMPRYPARSYVPKKRVYKKRAPAKRGPRAGPYSGPPTAYPVRKKNYTYSKPGPWGRTGSYLGGLAGSAVGGPIGGMVGSAAGGLAHYIGKIFGSGDYVASKRPRANSILSPQAPSFSGSSGTVRIRHREFLGDVYSSPTANTFDINFYSINPGLSRPYPWLSKVCGSTFQQYQINGQCYEFRSMSSDALNSTNTALGQVIMCTDYDSADVAFTSKQQMENTEFGVSCKPSTNMLHAIECASKRTSMTKQYIRAYNNPPNTDVRMYDLGKFYIATNGCQGTNVNLGELWVTYDITLFKTIEQVPGFLNPFSTFALTGVSASAPFGTSRSAFPIGQPGDYNQIGITFSNSTTIQFPMGTPLGSTYLISYILVGAAPAAFTNGGVNSGNLYISTNVALFAPSNGAVTSQVIGQWAVQYKGGADASAPAEFQIQPFTWAPAGGILEADLLITQISGNFSDNTYTSVTLSDVLPSIDDAPEYTIVEEMKQPLRVRRVIKS
jgi:hypothetical protein